MPEASDPTHISGHKDVIIASRASNYTEKDMVPEGRDAGKHRLCPVMWEGAVEGGADNWGEVVTR